MKYWIFLFPFLFLARIAKAQVKFDANFESGNLASVQQIDSTDYKVTTREDIGGRWFYFRMSGVKNKTIAVEISNSDVNRAMYSYDNRNYERFTESEAPYVNYFKKNFTKDTVYVAYYIPYTFSYLQKRLKEWTKSSFVKLDTIGFTPKGLPQQLLTVTDFTVPDSGKYRVWIHARTHPGETPSSFHFDGIVRELLKNDDVIDFYRKNIVFYLVPFDNPDGVYYGRSRTNFSGVDLERQWDKPDDKTALEVLHLKQKMTELNKQKVFSVFLNLHSQASSYCTFWIHSAQSTSPRFYRIENQFANLNTSDNQYFTPNDYSHSNLHSYFPEGWLWNNYGEKVLALTYETPYDHYSTGIWVTNENLYEIGARTVYSIGEFLKLSTPKRIILDNDDAGISGQWQTDTAGIEFFGNDYYVAPPGNGESKLKYSTGLISKGLYDVYAWWPHSENFAFNTGFKIEFNGESHLIQKTERTNGGQWNFIGEAKLTRDGAITITVGNNASDTVAADAFRIIYRGEISEVAQAVSPSDFELFQNYPNPFNPVTRIKFTLNKSGNVQLSVFNLLGERVAVLVDDYLQKGTYEYVFNPEKYGGLASGIYFYKLTFNNQNVSKAMVYLK